MKSHYMLALSQLWETYSNVDEKSLKEDFVNRFGVNVKSNDNFVMFDYHQVKADWDVDFVSICRGLILDKHNGKLVCGPFTKFWNLGESHASDIDWESTHVFEKLDGSMVSRWWDKYNQKFQYTTRFQLPEDMESNFILKSNTNWMHLAKTTIEKCFVTSTQHIDKTFVFEVMSPLNRVVIKHSLAHAKIIGIRDNKTGEEESVTDCYEEGPKTFAFANPNDIVEFANQLDGHRQEGFIVCDKYFSRVKIKGDSYVRLHRLKDRANSVANLLAIIYNGEEEEVGLHFPEVFERCDLIKTYIKTYCNELQEVYDSLKHIEPRKDFAIALKEKQLAGQFILFGLKSNQQNVHTYVMDLPESKFVRFFESLIEANIKLPQEIFSNEL